VELLQAGYDVVIADNLKNSKRAAIGRIREITGRDPTFYPVDLMDRSAVEQIFREQPIDAVIHFAGLKAVGESVSRPLDYYCNNIGSTAYLCMAMQKFGVRTLVFSSSAAIYGTPESVPVSEDAVLSPQSPYGRTKLMIEEMLKDLCASEPGWCISLLRYFNPIGAHGSGAIGEDPNDIPNNLMPLIMQVALRKREKLSVFGNDYSTPDGTAVRDYIHVVDLAKGHLKALEWTMNNDGAEAFNFGTGRGCSVLDMITNFERATGVPVPYQFAPRRPGDVTICYADPAKAMRLLGWKAEHSLQDMCRDAWRWQNGNPDGYPAD
jgi:UDP-glucose 4-epimerase